MQDAAEDKKLVSLAMAGDRQAFGELVLRHRAKLIGWTRTMMRDRFHAEDIVQEALSKSFAQIGRLQDSDKFLPWLRRIVRNEMLMKLRKKEHALPGSEDEVHSLADERETHNAKYAKRKVGVAVGADIGSLVVVKSVDVRS